MFVLINWKTKLQNGEIFREKGASICIKVQWILDAED